MLLFRIIILFSIFFISGMARAEGNICKTHKIYCAIVKLQPAAAPYAMELSNYIYKYSKQYGTDPYISIAIAMQESGIRNIHRSAEGVTATSVCSNEDESDCEMQTTKTRVYTDFGMFQFHYSAMSDYDLDFGKVYEHDMEYIVKKHVKILKNKIDMCAIYEDEAWTCYHSATEKHRLKYKSMVTKYLRKIKNH